ncbi:MAG: PBSX family phage terminase large subunit [Clostridia bacterium]|nr:PBSX family phage terminase large subunit [Clostridia bacterium]
MANEQNLKKIRSTSEARELGARGGKASGVARRKKKELTTLCKELLEMPMHPGKLTKLKTAEDIMGEDPNLTIKEAMMLAQIQRAMDGDTRAFGAIAELFEAGVAEDRQRALTEAAHSAEAYRIDPLLIADTFAPVRRDILAGGHSEYVLYGGRGSTKSSFISVEIPELLKNNPQMHALVLRQVGNTLRDSVYNQLLWGVDLLGLGDEFEAKVSPMEITYKPTGQKIYFRGADDPNKVKSIKVPFGYIGILWLEELDQFKGPEAVRKIEQSAIRGGDVAYKFKTFNPPKSANNWANQYIQIPNPKRLDHHSTYQEVPTEWLGQAFLDDAAYLKEVNPDAYEHEYLGIANGSGGMVFDNVECREITDDEIKQFDRIYRGVDWGWYPDPFHYAAMHYDAARQTLYIFDEYRANKQSNRETADALFARGVTGGDLIQCDSAEQKSVGDYRAFGLLARAVEKGPGSVDYSMKWLQSLRKIIIDPVRCPAAAQEFLHYEYERDKDGNIISGYPDTDNHAIDAVRYAMQPVWRKKGR